MVGRRRATGELAYDRCSTPRPVPPARLVKVAGQRRRIAQAIQTGKGLAGWISTSSAAGAPGTAG
jgi:hypothetical protein